MDDMMNSKAYAVIFINESDYVDNTIVKVKLAEDYDTAKYLANEFKHDCLEHFKNEAYSNDEYVIDEETDVNGNMQIYIYDFYHKYDFTIRIEKSYIL